MGWRKCVFVFSSFLNKRRERLITRFVQLKIDQRVFLSPSKRKLEVNIVQSNFHIEITPRYAFTLFILFIAVLRSLLVEQRGGKL